MPGTFAAPSVETGMRTKRHPSRFPFPVLSIVMMLSIVACSSQSPPDQGNVVVNDAVTNADVPANAPAPATSDTRPVPAGTPGTPGGLPDDRTPLEEPQGPID